MIAYIFSAENFEYCSTSRASTTAHIFSSDESSIDGKTRLYASLSLKIRRLNTSKKIHPFFFKVLRDCKFALSAEWVARESTSLASEASAIGAVARNRPHGRLFYFILFVVLCIRKVTSC